MKLISINAIRLRPILDLIFKLTFICQHYRLSSKTAALLSTERERVYSVDSTPICFLMKTQKELLRNPSRDRHQEKPA